MLLVGERGGREGGLLCCYHFTSGYDFFLKKEEDMFIKEV